MSGPSNRCHASGRVTPTSSWSINQMSCWWGATPTSSRYIHQMSCLWRATPTSSRSIHLMSCWGLPPVLFHVKGSYLLFSPMSGWVLPPRSMGRPPPSCGQTKPFTHTPCMGGNKWFFSKRYVFFVKKNFKEIFSKAGNCIFLVALAFNKQSDLSAHYAMYLCACGQEVTSLGDTIRMSLCGVLGDIT